MLNKQIITIITVSFLWIAGTQIAFAKKPAEGGGGNHMQRGIELAQQKHFDAAAEEFTKARMLVATQTAARRIARERALP